METRTVTWFLMMAILGSGRTQDSACMKDTMPLKMTGSSGNIISPLNYSNTDGEKYMFMTWCEYLITVGTGKIVFLYPSSYKPGWGEDGETFMDNIVVISGKSFKRKPHPSVKIINYIGNIYSKKLTGGGSLQSKGPNMFIRYTSYDTSIYDKTANRSTFNLTWYAVDDPCSSNKPLTLSGDSGWILSQSSNLDYNNYADCRWIVSVDRGMLVRLDVHKFILQGPAPNGTCSDEVIVYDGSSEESEPLTHNFCGSFKPHTITSGGSSLLIVLKSDNKSTAQGFNVSWSKMSKPVCSPSTRPEQITGLSYGDIKSLNFPHNYIPGLDCGWAITVARGMKIQLHFHTLQISHNENADDYVAVFDDVGQEVDLSGTLTTTNQPHECVESYDDTIYIVFKTNSQDVNKGFHLSWTASKSECSSTPLTVTGSTPGTTYHFASHNYPYAYADNLNCRWVISTTAPQVIQITFNNFTLEDRDGNNSCKDMIRAYDGDERNDSNALTEEICGSRLPDHITSTTDKLLLVFTTDDSARRDGFQLSWLSFFPCVPDKTIEVTGTRGMILSRNYPNDYDNNIVCSWHIKTTEAWEVRLSYNDFDVKRYENGACQDTLTAYNGESANQSNIIDGRAICGSHSPNDTLSSTRELFLQFRSDSMNTGTGFNISWKRTGFHPCHPEVRPVLITGEHGTVKSPNYPGNYGDSKNCQWKISVPTGRKIRLYIDELQLEWTWRKLCVDNLYVYDGSSPYRLLLGPLCGDNKWRGRYIFSKKSEVYLVLHTSRWNNDYRGFKISWKAVS